MHRKRERRPGNHFPLEIMIICIYLFFLRGTNFVIYLNSYHLCLFLFPPLGKGIFFFFWDGPEGWYREGGGSGVQDGEHMYARDGFMLMCGRTNTIL